MIAELICVGTELLMGQVVNTNAQFLAKSLVPLGISMYHQITVGDNAARLREAIETALSRADIVILTGGLGPTDDDMTKEIAAEVFDLPLIENEEALAALKAYFAALNRDMPPINYKQAKLPQGSIMLPNSCGTAPGCILTNDAGKAAILLPGPPHELMTMFNKSVLPYLQQRTDCLLYSKEIMVFGKGEGAVAYELRDLIANQTNPTIATYAKPGQVEIRVTAQCRDEKDGETLLAPVVGEISSRFGDIIYSFEGESLAKVCADELMQSGQTLAVAESCTGGLLSAKLVDIPGCSSFLLEGCVTYSNTAKMKRLGVKEETLHRCGAVSAQCAKEMAEGMLQSAGSDIALATTGIAGPDGGTDEKPVGLIYIALATKSETIVQELHLSFNRERNRSMTVLHVLDLLRRLLQKKPLPKSVL